MTMHPRDWLLLIVLSVFWGGSFLFIEVALTGFPPLSVVSARVGVAAVILVCVARALGRRFPSGADFWGAMLVLSFFNNVLPFALIVWGQTRIDAGLASIMNATSPLFTAVLAHWFTTDDRLTGLRALGVVLGIGGVAVLIGPAVLEGIGGDPLGQLAVLAAALSYAGAGIYGRRFRGVSSLVAAAAMLAGSAAMIVPVALIVERPWTLSPPIEAFAALGGLAVVSTAVAYLLYFRILGRSGATNVLLVTFLNPVTAVLLGMALLGERPAWTAFAGMACIFAGLLAVDGRLVRRLFRSSGGSGASR